MIKLKPENMEEWDGFEVYDAETGERLSPSDVAEKLIPEDSWLPQIVDGFCLTWEGFLYLTCVD